MDERREIIVDLDNLSADDLKIMHDFFVEQEENLYSTMTFDENIFYKFAGNFYIKFNKKIVGYWKDYSGFKQPEWRYVVRSNTHLGSGGSASVYEVDGKLVHAADRMKYIKSTDKKSNYKCMLIIIDSIESLGIDQWQQYRKNKIPVLMKDINGDIHLFCRGIDNSWHINLLDKEKFANVPFPNSIGVMKSYNSDRLDVGAKDEIDNAQWRAKKVIKFPFKNSSEAGTEIEATRAAGQSAKRSRNKHNAIIMDMVPGQTLAKLLKNRKLTLIERNNLSIALIEALIKYLRRHYDIKPANIMIEETERGFHAKFIDHALSKSKDDLGHKDFVGSWNYVAPEMLTNPGEANEKCDVYSFGRVLKEVWHDKGMKDDLNNSLEIGIGFYMARFMYPYHPEQFPDAHLEQFPDVSELVEDKLLQDKIQALLYDMTRVDPNQRVDEKEILNRLIDIAKILEALRPSNELITPTSDVSEGSESPSTLNTPPTPHTPYKK